MIDVDHFKQFNDNYGHAVGDLILKCLVNLLMQTTREEDVVCRYGGEEFVVLMPNTTLEAAYQRAEYWRRACETMRTDVEGKLLGVTISLGVVTAFEPMPSAARLLAMADQAMYQAKALGRNRTVVFSQPSHYLAFPLASHNSNV